MDVKEAVRTAKSYVAELFREDGIVNLGLEEVVPDDETGGWQITIGFSRRWDRAAPFMPDAIRDYRRRDYKLVLIDGAGTIRGVKHRAVDKE